MDPGALLVPSLISLGNRAGEYARRPRRRATLRGAAATSRALLSLGQPLKVKGQRAISAVRRVRFSHAEPAGPLQAPSDAIVRRQREETQWCEIVRIR